MLKKTLFGMGLALLTVGLTSAGLFAQSNATFMLNNGDRHSGSLIYGRGDNNIVDLNFHLLENGNDRSFPMDSVAVIDFAGGNPNAERDMLPADNQGLMVMRNGSSVRGTLHNIISGDQVQWVNEAGQRNNIPIGQVSRLYLKPQNARQSFFTNEPTPQATTGQTASQGPGGSIRVPGNQQWVDTGIDVRNNERVTFRGSGDINAGNGASAGVAGSPIMEQSRMPLSSAPGASLIGRVGNGAPFAIGSNQNPISMNGTGRLYLGINDDQVGDNTGDFYVQVVTPGGGLFRRR